MKNYSHIGLDSKLNSVTSLAAKEDKFVSGNDFDADFDKGVVTATRLGSASVGSVNVIDSSIHTQALADGAVITEKFGTNSVSSEILQNLAVTAGKIAGNVVAGSHITGDALSGTHITAAQIDGTHILGTAIGGTHIGTAVIDAGHIGTAVINQGHLGTAIIGSANIQDAAIGSAHIGLAAIGAAAIQNAAIGSAAIGTAAIQAVHLGTAIISDANVGTMTFNTISGGTATLGGTENGDGVLSLKDSSGTERVLLDSSGIAVTGGSITVVNDTGGTVLDKKGIVSTTAFSSASVTGSGNQNTTSTSFVDATGLSINIVLDRTQNVLLFGGMAGYIQAWSAAETGALLTTGRLIVGTTQIGGILSTPGKDYGSAGEGAFVADTAFTQEIKQLTAGTHTLQLQFKSSDGSFTATIAKSSSTLGYVILGT